MRVRVGRRIALEGHLPVAERPAIRALTESVQDLVDGRARQFPDEETEWEHVAGLIFPDKPAIVTCELARALNCGRQLAMDLVHARQFRLVPGAPRIRPGPNGSPQIETTSAKEWLQKRRML